MLDIESSALIDLLPNERSQGRPGLKEQLREVVEEHERSGKPVMEIIENFGIFTKKEMLEAMAENLGSYVWIPTDEDLPKEAAGGEEAYVIADPWPEVSLRLSAGEAELGDVQAMLCMPDHLFDRLLQSEAEEPLERIVQQAAEAAEQALTAHPENVLYTQLAQSLSNWCTLMEDAGTQLDGQAARRYAAVSMGTLCRELRMALLGSADQASEESTASAQRTPSTAADVMPPA